MSVSASKRLEERLVRAARRREAMLEERRVVLAAQEEQRRDKLKQVAKLRKEALQQFILKAPAVFAAFERAGLVVRDGEMPTADAVEDILTSDPRTCDQCAGTENEQKVTCPVTKKPHRRSLVTYADQLLRLIGNARVNLAPSKYPSEQPSLEARPIKAAAAGANNSSSATRRGISIHPHFFVLIFYNAALKELQDEAELILHMCAQQLVDLVEELRCALKDPHGRDARYIQELLGSFARAWRPYAKYADGVTAESRMPIRRRFALDELKQSVLDSFVACRVALHRRQSAANNNNNNNSRLAALAEHLEERLVAMDREAKQQAEDIIAQRVASEQPPESPIMSRTATGVVGEASQQGEQQQQQQPNNGVVVSPMAVEALTDASATTAADISTPPVTPETRPQPTRTAIVPPAAPLNYGTSGSDTDSAGVVGLSLRYFGPDLPPMWFVDRDGISRPPPPEALLQAKQEQLRKLEFRARTAFQMKLKLVDDKSEAENAAAEANRTVLEATFAQFEKELNQSPLPNLQRVPSAINAVMEALVEALPKRLRGRIGKELHDVLDWSSLRKAVTTNTMHIANVMQYVVGKVAELGAPARAEDLHARSQQLTELLASGSKPLGEVVVQMFRFMLDGIRQLRLDVAQFTLQMVSQEMVQHTEEYHREYLDATGPVESWERSAAFLETYRSAADGIASLPEFIKNSTATTEEEARVRGAVFAGALDLLRSANRCSETRWAAFPTESMRIEQGQIFKLANTVQRDTLRLMLTGTISMVINRKPGVTPAALSSFLKALDQTAMTEWLPRSANVAELKGSILETVNSFLANEITPPTLLSDPEATMLSGLVDKMIDTCSTTYNSFEGRVLGTVRTAFLTDSAEYDRIPPSARPLTCGLVTASAWEIGGSLRRLMEYHWSVLRPSYMILDALRQINDGQESPIA